MSSIDIHKLKLIFDKLSKLIMNTLIIFLWITSFIMITILVLAVIKITYGIYHEFLHVVKHDASGILEILEGLELIFISPLAYLLGLALTKYLFSTKPEINPELISKQNFVKHSMSEIGNVKIFITGLLITLLLIHAVKLSLTPNINIKSIALVFATILISIIYYIVLEKISKTNH